MPPSRRRAAIRRWLAAAAALLAAAAAFGSCGGDTPALTTLAGDAAGGGTGAGSPAAPAFRITLLDGTVFDLADHLSHDGRPVLLNLWASSCIPCRREMQDLDAVARRHPEVLFLGVAVDDDPDGAAGCAADVGVSYPVGIDADGALAEAFATPGPPATFLIGDDGTLIGAVYEHLDEDGIEALVTTRFGG